MFRLVLCLAASLAVAAGGRSTNAGLIEKYLMTKFFGPNVDNDVLKDALLDGPELIQKYGYPLEIHHVTTEDGYILEMHRIPHGRDDYEETGRPAVLVMHGLVTSSDDFLLLGPDNALAYVLADAGYDVWLGNARGNHYSRRHLTLDPDDKKYSNFWRFSWEQIGYYDLPAFVDHILAFTGQQKLHYVGHSQGGTVFLVLNSLRPEYNQKFKSFHGMAPAAYFDNNRNSLFKLLAPQSSFIDAIAFKLGFAELLGTSPLNGMLGIGLCSNLSILEPLCAKVVTAVGNFDKNFNKTLLPVFLGHIPAGASIRQVTHYAQVFQSKAFARYDYDFITNFRLYGRTTPPEFDVSLITVPSYLYYALADQEVDYRDVLALSKKLINTVSLVKAETPRFNHYDFIMGGKVKADIYDNVVEMLRESDRIESGQQLTSRSNRRNL